jgi:hypothetical protein|uniref:Uncharacterized protein n=1 Tax=viral metagenome TaxID=1070528 RepID=A0A6C0LZS9_9ZZZZ
MGSQKILTNEKYIYSDKEFQVYKTKKGAKLIKINNNYVNINDISIVSKINNKKRDDIILNNINELNNLDINNEIPINDNEINYSIDGEEYIVI